MIRRSWRLAIAIALIATGAATATTLAIRWRRLGEKAAWDAIDKAARGGRSPEVRARLQRWVASHPDHGESRVLLANIELGLRHRDAAVDLLGAVRPDDPSWARARMLLGTLAVRERRAAEAERIFREVADRDPQAIEARRNLLYLLGLELRTAEARGVLWELYRMREDPRILVDLVLDLVTDPDVRGLAPELELLVAATPDDPLLARAWGMSLLYQGRPGQALPQLELAARRLADDPSGRFALAECRLMLGKPVDADSVLGPPPERPAGASRWWLYRGRIEDATGRPDGAVASFRRAVESNPRNREARFRLGQALERAGRAEEARGHLAQAGRIEEALKAVRRGHQDARRGGLDPDPRLFERLGRLCADAGLVAESRAWFARALKLDPSSAESRRRLAELRDTSADLPIALDDPRPVSTGQDGVARGHGRDGAIIASRGDRKPPDPAEKPPPFVDGAEAAGISYLYESGARGDRLFLPDSLGGGVGLIDCDNDGWLDIYFINGCALPYDPGNPPRPNLLYRNQHDGTFRDVTARSGVAGKGYGMGCAVGDYDNDGDDDLFVTGLRGTILYRNRGDGAFEDVTSSAGVFSDRWTTAAGFGDLDGDGDLDLVVIAYARIDLDDRSDCRDGSGRGIHCAPTRYPAQADLLYRNNGDGTFNEVSAASGFVALDGRGLGLAIADLDDDGKLDIFVANDGTPNFLFRNRGGLRFDEIGLEAGVATNGSGRATASMGVVAEDLDGDGRIDLFFTNLVNESNTLFRNLGKMVFVDATLGAGLSAPSRPRTGFGDAALDADNDGRLDLFVANGHVDHRPWANSPMAQTPLFFRGRDRGRFAPVGRPGSSSDYFSRSVVGRGVAAGDLNNDGSVDLVVVHRDAPAALLWNRSGGGHWLGLRLRGTASGRTPIGARVTCRSGGRSMTRWLTGGTGYLSAHDPRLWFGLGPAAIAERIEVTWPSGRTQSWTDLASDRIVAIEEGGRPRDDFTPGRPPLAGQGPARDDR